MPIYTFRNWKEVVKNGIKELHNLYDTMSREDYIITIDRIVSFIPPKIKEEIKTNQYKIEHLLIDYRDLYYPVDRNLKRRAKNLVSFLSETLNIESKYLTNKKYSEELNRYEIQNLSNLIRYLIKGEKGVFGRKTKIFIRGDVARYYFEGRLKETVNLSIIIAFLSEVWRIMKNWKNYKLRSITKNVTDVYFCIENNSHVLRIFYDFIFPYFKDIKQIKNEEKFERENVLVFYTSWEDLLKSEVGKMGNGRLGNYLWKKYPEYIIATLDEDFLIDRIGYPTYSYLCSLYEFEIEEIEEHYLYYHKEGVEVEEIL